MINGQIEFYDEDSRWGLIRGEDGHLYDVRAAQLAGGAPRVGDKVLFASQTVPGGRRAVAVRRLTPPPAPIVVRRGGMKT
jgi:cold shock CspA family protein